MSDSRPNVVVVFTDQQRWDTAGCYGNEMGLTPNLDAMARRGTLVRSAFTCQPVCGPARASLQTGLYATATGCFRNGIPLPTNLPTLARLFAAAGYDTGYVGKWHLADTNNKPVPPELRGGYRFWRASDVLEFSSHPYDGCVFDENGKSVRLRGYRVDALTDMAMDFMAADRGGGPFLLFLSYLEPHFQNDMVHFVAPDGYADRYRDCYVPPDLSGLGGSAASSPPSGGDWRQELPDYYGMCASIDENLGRLLDHLQRLGIADNTVVAFTSDHGCHFRTRNGEYKRSCHESSIRIPMVFDGPGFRGGGQVQELVSLVDVPPTLLSAAGLRPPARMHGRDMLELLCGRQDAAAAWPTEVFVQISENHVGRAIRTDRWKYSAIAPGKNGGTDAASEVYVDDFLYDLQADPHELNNLAGNSDYGEITEAMRLRLIERMAAAGEQRPTILSR